MPFRPKSNLPDFHKLRATFVGARDQIKNYLLFQTIIQFLGSTQKMETIFKEDIEELDVAVFGEFGLKDAQYATVVDESTSGVLPNSRQLLEGVNIDYDDVTANERTVSVIVHPFLIMGG